MGQWEGCSGKQDGAHQDTGQWRGCSGLQDLTWTRKPYSSVGMLLQWPPTCTGARAEPAALSPFPNAPRLPRGTSSPPGPPMCQHPPRDTTTPGTRHQEGVKPHRTHGRHHSWPTSTHGCWGEGTGKKPRRSSLQAKGVARPLPQASPRESGKGKERKANPEAGRHPPGC